MQLWLCWHSCQLADLEFGFLLFGVSSRILHVLFVCDLIHKKGLLSNDSYLSFARLLTSLSCNGTNDYFVHLGEPIEAEVSAEKD